MHIHVNTYKTPEREGGIFGNAMAALEAFAAGGGKNFTAALADLHEQFKKVFIRRWQIFVLR